MLTEDDELRRVLQEAQAVAVVGASSSEDKAAHEVPAYLHEHGYDVIPVNPGSDDVLGLPTVESLSQVDRDVDVVDVFRPAEEAPGIARAAVGIGAKVLWLQQGIESEEARGIAEDAGLEVVMDECMMSAHRRLGIGEDGATAG